MQAAPAQGGGMMAGLAGTMASGMAFGAGSEVEGSDKGNINIIEDQFVETQE